MTTWTSTPRPSGAHYAKSGRHSGRGRDVLIALGLLAVLLGGLYAVTRDAPEASSGASAASTAPEGAVSGPMAAELARLEAENQRLEDQLAGWSSSDNEAQEIAELRAENDALREEIKRYGQAIDRQQQQQTRSDTGRPSATRTPGTQAPWVVAEARIVDVGEDHVAVQGRVHNITSWAVSGVLVLSLRQNGREIESHRLPMDVPTRAVKNYSASLPCVCLQHLRYEVTAEWSDR